LAIVLAVSFASWAISPASIEEGLSTRPILPTQSILWVSPAHGEENVSLDRPIVIASSEPMNSSSISWTIIPPVTESGYSWSNGSSVLTISHDPFAPWSQYTVLFMGAPDPGGVPNPWSFRTVAVLLPAENLEIKRI